MPVFDYKCDQCGRVTEMRVKTSDEVVYCYNCEHQMTKQLAAPYGKVTGYSYANGYAKKGSK
jgi:putative FmdB family regulatory protein